MSEQSIIEQDSEEICPVCEGVNLIKEGKCIYCFDCGWSKCEL